jgi:hypothetical protein
MLAWLGLLKIEALMIRFANRGYLPAVFKALQEVIRKLPVLLKESLSNSTAWLYLKLKRQQGPLRWDLISWLLYKT